jgi:hypothetical protein
MLLGVVHERYDYTLFEADQPPAKVQNAKNSHKNIM